MRKHAIIIVTLLLAFLMLAACSQDQNGGNGAAATEAAQVIEATPTNTATPTPTLPPTFTPEPMGHGGHLYAVSTRQIHIVQAGETMGSIANQYDVTVQDLARANRIYDYHTIYTGQVLFVPC